MRIWRYALALLCVATPGAVAQPPPAIEGVWGSTLGRVRLTTTSELPRGPGIALDDYCSSKAIDARSPQGRAVEARGWHVTAEQPLGRYQAVSFAGRFEPMTSGVCRAIEGNVAIFEGSALRAIVHAARPADDAPRFVTLLGTPDRLRLWGEEYAPPIADLVATPLGVTVTRVASADRWCDGAVSVPNVFASGIQAARTRILRVGWQPDPPPANEIVASSFGRDAALRRQGVTEVQGCSGTGYGLCAFSYRSGTGPTLEVITAGDEPSVVDYGVTCRPRQQ